MDISERHVLLLDPVLATGDFNLFLPFACPISASIELCNFRFGLYEEKFPLHALSLSLSYFDEVHFFS